MAPRFSVIVLLDRDQPDPCLPSLFQQTDSSFEVIAVTNPGATLPEDPRLRVQEVADRNPARRRNLAAQTAGGEILAFLDDDASAPADWLETAERLFQAHPELTGLGGPNLAPAEAPWQEWLSDVILATPFIGSGNPTYREDGKAQPALPGDLHLCNFFVRRERFEQAGGFNQALGYGAEDSEFIYRARRDLDHRFGFFPELTVTHRRRPFGPAYLAQRFRLRRQNGKLFWVYPDMYKSNPSLWTGLGLLLFALISLMVRPGLAFYWAALYFVMVLLLSRKRSFTRPRLIPLVPLAFFLHHLTYALGLGFGLLEGLLKGPSRLRQRLGRPAKS